jgi:hypothetical protein
MTVGTALKLVGVEPVRREDRDSGRDRDPAREHGPDPLAELGRPRRGQARSEDGELVAAEAPHPVHWAHRALDAIDDPAEELIARAVPVEVVDGLEVVQVEQDQAGGAAGSERVVQLRSHLLLEPAAVERSGQRVRARHLDQPLADAIVVLRLPGAENRREGEADGDEPDVARVGVPIEVADDQEREHV